MNVGGLDIGTTGCKLSVYTDNGEFLLNVYREYDAVRKSGKHEIDAEAIFGAVCEVIAEAARTVELSAIGVTSFGEAFTVLDEADRVLLPSMLYTDPRGSEECEYLCRTVGEEVLTNVLCLKPHSMYSLPKLMWIREHLPDVYSRVRRVLLMQDYTVYMLCGKAQIDYSLAARTMAFDVRKKCWSKELLEAAKTDVALLSEPVPSGTVAGKIKPELAKRLGISADVLIVTGAHDQVASAVGAGVFDDGEAVDGTGTVECITPVFKGIPDGHGLYGMHYCAVPYVFEDTYVCYAFSYTGGAALKWFRDELAVRGDVEENIYKRLDALVPKEPTGLLVLPHFAGAATPYMDSASRAAIVGLTLESTSSDIYKALMEGVTYEIMLNLEKLCAAGIRPRTLYATGGGAASDVWLQIKADILGIPITALSSREAGACGTCMLTGTAIGIYSDLYEAKKRFVSTGKTYFPRKEYSDIYAKYYGAYRKLYDAVRPVVEELL